MNKIIRSELFSVLVIMVLGVFAMNILLPVLPLYFTSIGVSPEMLGIMLSVAVAGMVIGESSWGWVADKLGVKIPLSTATFVCSIVVFFFVLTQNVPTIFLILFFWGLVSSALYGPGRGYVAAAAPSSKKATYMAIATITLSTSRSLGSLPSGFIVDNFGYEWVFMVSSSVGLLGGIVVLAGLNKLSLIQSQKSEPSLTPNDEFNLKGQKLNYRILVFQSAIAFLYLLRIGISTTFLPLLATQMIGVEATEVGILFTIIGLSTTIAALPIGALADRVGKKAFMVLGLLMSSVSMVGIAYSKGYLWLVIFAIVGGVAWAAFGPSAQGILSESVPPKKQSTALGIYGGLGENMGFIAGSSLGGFIWSAFGPRITFLTGAIATGFGAVLCSFYFFKNKIYTRL